MQIKSIVRQLISSYKQTRRIHALQKVLRAELHDIDPRIVVTSGTLTAKDGTRQVAFARVSTTKQIVVSARFLLEKAERKRVPVGVLVYQLKNQLEHECEAPQYDLASLY